MGDSALIPLTANDGDNIAVQDWYLDDDVPSRGTVLIVHGLGEHAGRYAPVAQVLNSWGFDVRSYDQYGHGDSGGVRGALPHTHRLLDDLADVVDDTRHRLASNRPLILLGHSMGGVVAAQFVLQKLRRVEALVLSSPAFDPGLSAIQKMLLATLPRFAPHMRVGNGLKPHYLSRDASVVAHYKKDPLVHDRISAGLAHWIASQGASSLLAAQQWRLPTLLMYAGADRLVSPAGSQAFAAAAPPKIVHSRCFAPMFHEIFNDPERAKVFACLKAWLDRILP